MPNATLRANAQAMPKATEPAAESMRNTAATKQTFARSGICALAQGVCADCARPRH